MKEIERWKKAFPLAGFAPALKTPNEEDYQLARKFCPRLHVDLEIITEERNYISQNLNDKNIAEALFLYTIGNFPDELSGSKMYLLATGSQDVNERTRNIERIWDPEILRIVREECSRTSLKNIHSYMESLFINILPENDPTFLIKFRVVRSEINPSIYCIQYFTYWPIQLFPYHVFDYEPVYVFVNKISVDHYEPILITYNANPGSIDQSVFPIFKGKRPGHKIRTYINWDIPNIPIMPNQYNPMADYMTEAYGGEYLYEKIEGYRKTHTDHLLDRNKNLSFQINTKWHAYESHSDSLDKKNQYSPCKLEPLKTQDLFHIEWDIRNPFQAPFLYPIVGRKKNQLMHLPFTISTIIEPETFQKFNTYALRSIDRSLKYGKSAMYNSAAANMDDYRRGLYVDLLCGIDGRPKPEELWKKIEEISDQRNLFHTLEYNHVLSEVIRRDPRDVVALRLRGFYWYDVEPERSIDDLNRAIEINPNDSRSLLKRGACFFYWKRYEEAISDLNRSIELNSENTLAYYFRGMAHWSLNNNNAALSDLNRGLEINPNYPELLIMQGSILTQFKRYEEALSDYNQVIALPPTSRRNIEIKEIIFTRGKMHLFSDQLNDALADFKWAIKLDSTYAIAFFYCGLAHAELEQWDDALVNIEHAIKLGLSDKDQANAESLLDAIKEHISEQS